MIQVYKFFYEVSIFIFKSILLYSCVPIANLELLTLSEYVNDAVLSHFGELSTA